MSMNTPRTSEPIRISHIAGRYLVFDPDAVARLRRCEHINGTLVGTTPQQPTQNVFLGLPIELRPEEVRVLVDGNSAYVLDSVDAHKTALRSDRSATERKCYVASLRNSKQVAHYTWSQRIVSRATERSTRRSLNTEDVNGRDSNRIDESHVLTSDSHVVQRNKPNMNVRALAVTPVSSATLVASATVPQAALTAANPTLCGLLQSRGYYTTPGLRFGCRYSVYPGDPLRFHAHFMANEYQWDEQIPMLDIVGGGRLATAVKKAFLIGGCDGSGTSDTDTLRTYSIEWAAM